MKLHVFHDWGKWKTVNIVYESYPWTKEGNYANKIIIQQRVCQDCDKLQSREVNTK